MMKRDDRSAFMDLTSVLRRRWKMMAMAGALGCGLGAIGFLIPAKYTAKAQIAVDLPVVNIVGTLDDAAIETRVELLLSESHLRRVLAALDAKGVSLAQEAAPVWNRWFGWADDPKSRSALVRLLQKNTNAFKERKSRVIGITYMANDPVLAAEVANTSVSVFLQSLGIQRQNERDEKLRSIDAQMPRARFEAERTDAALQTYRAEAGIADNRRADATRDEIVDLTRQLSLARTELWQRQEKMRLLRNLSRTSAAPQDISEALRNPVLADAFQGGFDLRATGGTQEDPGSRLASMVEQQLFATNAEADRFTLRVRNLQQRLDTVKLASDNLRASEARLRGLENDANAASALFQSLMKQQVELRSSAVEPLDIRVSSPASPPEDPSSPNPLVFIAPAMTIALFFSSLLALGLDRLDDKIRSERDVSEALGARCAGLVPKIVGRARKNARLDLRRRPFAPYTEALRRVAMSVLARLPASAEPGIVALASSLPGEGKSMMAGDLASYLALIGKRVLLVELDFRGSVETTAPGVIDALNGAPLDEAIQKLPNSDADCLRMQAIKDDPLVHVQPMRLRLALQRVGRGYDIVVIDAGALLAAAEAEAVCHAADFVLFAVAWGRTRIDVARNAFQRLDPNISEVVVTKVDLRRHASFRFGDSAEALTRNGRKAQRQAS